MPRIIWPLKFAFAVLALSRTMCAAAEPAPKPLVPRDDVPGVKNFAEVSPVLWRGAQPTAAGFAELRRRGVKTIVNLRSTHSDRDKLAGTGLQYVHFRCNAWHAEAEDVVKFLKVVQDPNNQPVFVHCQHGADRTGVMVAAFRMVEQGWTADDTIDEVRRFGFHSVFREIVPFVKRFDRETISAQVSDAESPRIDVVR